jgi:hypothetical protein
VVAVIISSVSPQRGALEQIKGFIEQHGLNALSNELPLKARTSSRVFLSRGASTKSR